LLSGWPANSPDLNPIELLWAILKHEVAVMAPETIDELKQVIQQAWDAISLDVIDNLCSGFVCRLRMCLDVHGNSISKLLGLCEVEAAAGQWRSDTQIREAWRPEEDQIIYQIVRRDGLRWAHLEKLLPGRTANAIKNRWYAVLRRREQKIIGDTAKWLDVRERLREGQAIPEICQGE
jgi:hypothetical protein